MIPLGRVDGILIMHIVFFLWRLINCLLDGDVVFISWLVYQVIFNGWVYDIRVI